MKKFLKIGQLALVVMLLIGLNSCELEKKNESILVEKSSRKRKLLMLPLHKNLRIRHLSLRWMEFFK